jgi:hypothetical protein
MQLSLLLFTLFIVYHETGEPFDSPLAFLHTSISCRAATSLRRTKGDCGPKHDVSESDGAGVCTAAGSPDGAVVFGFEFYFLSVEDIRIYGLGLRV